MDKPLMRRNIIPDECCLLTEICGAIHIHTHFSDGGVDAHTVIKNGQMISKKMGMKENFEITESGLYRIEVFRGKNAWIYSNPFPLGSYPLY